MFNAFKDLKSFSPNKNLGPNKINIETAQDLVIKMLSCNFTATNGFFYRLSTPKEGFEMLTTNQANSLVQFLNDNNIKCCRLESGQQISAQWEPACYIKFDSLYDKNEIIDALNKLFASLESNHEPKVKV